MSHAPQQERSIDGMALNAYRRYMLPSRVKARALERTGLRECNHCHEHKTVAEFAKGKATCRPCQKEQRALWTQTTIEGRSKTLYHSARTRAKQWGVEFSLSQQWIQQQLRRGTCALTGMPFAMELSPQHKATNPLSPSIDRIVAGGPYSEGNCRLVTLAINLAMGQWGEDTFAIVSKNYLKYKDLQCRAQL